MDKTNERKIIDSKVVLIGSTSSDKTSIICRALSDEFDSELPATIGACYSAKQVELADATVNLQIWDSAGQERFKTLAPMYYRGSIVIIVTFSLIDVYGLDEAREWITCMKKQINEKPILFLVGSKCDIIDERVISFDDGVRLADEFNAFYYEVSAKTGRGIEELFTNAAIESAQKLCQEILVVSSIKCNFNAKTLGNMKIENPNIYLTFSIKNNSQVVKNSGLIENTLNPSWDDFIRFCIFDKKPDILIVNIFHKSETDEVNLVGNIEFQISASKKSMKFEKSVYLKKDHFSKKEIARISFKLDRTNYEELMKERELLISQVNKQKNENSASEHKAEIAAKTRENEAELTKKSNELEDLQNTIHKYEAEMEKKTKESEDQFAEKTKEIKELQEKIHKYEDEMEKKTKEFENELNKKSNEIKELKDKMHKLIENHDKEIQNIRNEFQNHQPVNTSNDKSIKKANNKFDSEKVSENPEKVNESLEKVDDSVNKANEENCFFGIDDEAHFETIKKLGEGMTSVVYKIIDNRTKVPLCKKVLKVEGATFKDLQNAVKEFHLLHCLRHQCICYSIAINTSEIYTEETETSDEVTTVALLLEFVDFNLKECLANNILNNTLKTRIVVEIIHAMRYLHSNGLIYRDLKIDNIMLNSVFQVKMIDFGLARINECLFGEEMMNTISLTKGVGNAHFMSPEMMKEEDYDNKTDVFSFGIVLYVIFFGNLPKQTMKEKAMGKAINIPEESSSISKCCIELMKICIADDPKERPSFEEILEFLRKCKFMLSPDVDPSIVEQRDKELEFFKFKNNNE